jgi:hypothetical protein
MDHEPVTMTEPRRRSPMRAVAVALLIGLIGGVAIDRFLLPSGNTVEVVAGEVGVVSADLDRITLSESNESYDLTHATGVECLDGLERGASVELGVATVETGDSNPPDEAFLNTPEATVALWVECPGG